MFREESERVSELKNSTGSNTLPSGNLVLGSEAIKDSITGYDDAYVNYIPHFFLLIAKRSKCSRKSDIENERLPPELVDPEEARGLLSNPASPIDGPDASVSNESATIGTSSPGSSGALPSPASPGSPFRRGHGRQQSLGTTSTSPSTRRRSIENTASLIREAMEENARGESELEALAESLASPSSTTRRRSDSGSGSGYEGEKK